MRKFFIGALLLLSTTSMAQTTKSIKFKLYDSNSADMYLNLGNKDKKSSWNIGYGTFLMDKSFVRDDNASPFKSFGSGFINSPMYSNLTKYGTKYLPSDSTWGNNGLSANFNIKSSFTDLNFSYVGYNDLLLLNLGGNNVKGFFTYKQGRFDAIQLEAEFKF